MAQRIAFCGFIVLVVAMGIGRFAFTPQVPLMIRDGQLNLTSAGLVAALNYLGYLLGAWDAMRAQRYIEVRLWLGIGGAVVLTFLSSVADNALIHGALRLVIGAMSGWAMVLIAAWTNERLAHAGKPGLSAAVFAGPGAGIALSGLLAVAIQAKGLTLGDVAVSSSVTRAFLSEGEVEMASRCLARPYALSGHVVSGFQEGRGMGFPTANIIVDNVQKLIPARGAYAVRVTDESASGVRYVGMLNIGLRPTMKEKVEKETIEVHLLGYNGDLYGHLLKVEFIERLREEHKFRSKAELIRQLQADEARVESMRHKILED